MGVTLHGPRHDGGPRHVAPTLPGWAAGHPAGGAGGEGGGRVPGGHPRPRAARGPLPGVPGKGGGGCWRERAGGGRPGRCTWSAPWCSWQRWGRVLATEGGGAGRGAACGPLPGVPGTGEAHGPRLAASTTPSRCCATPLLLTLAPVLPPRIRSLPPPPPFPPLTPSPRLAARSRTRLQPKLADALANSASEGSYRELCSQLPPEVVQECLLKVRRRRRRRHAAGGVGAQGAQPEGVGRLCAVGVHRARRSRGWGSGRASGLQRACSRASAGRGLWAPAATSACVVALAIPPRPRRPAPAPAPHPPAHTLRPRPADHGG
jgi:hypothetical protein